MLQNRINELNSAILDIYGNKVQVTGFTREEMLRKYLNEGWRCYSSIGIYDYQKLDFHNIKDNALIIVRKEGKEINRYKFKPILKERIQYKDKNLLSLTITIRKSMYSQHYHYLTEKESLLFKNTDDLKAYMLQKYNYRLSI